MKKLIQFGCLLATAVCFAFNAEAKPLKVNMGYIFTTHHTPFIAAMSESESFEDFGVHLESVVPKQKYDLYHAGKRLARLNIVVSKSGSETSTLFAQNRLDLGLASITAMLTGIDRGNAVKILCPTHVDGMGLVFPKGSKIKGWDEVSAFIESSKQPVKVGYHSPTSAPRMVIEGALRQAGLTVTQDFSQQDADVLLVDLKSTSNLIPALVSKQVDCWVGPAPYPEVAEIKGVGHIGLDLRNLPPQGQWHNFPCCVMAGTERMLAKHPEVVQALVQLMTKSAAWCNEHPAKVAQIMANWIGVPAEAVKRSSIIYTTEPTEHWKQGVDMFLDMLNSMDKFKAKLKDKNLSQIEDVVFDFRFTEKNN
jgi:NitT/TauT family transport system substrate-binding protein